MQWSWPQGCLNLLLLNFMRRQKFDVLRHSVLNLCSPKDLLLRLTKTIHSCCILIPSQCDRGYFNMIKLSYSNTDQSFVHHKFFFLSSMNVFLISPQGLNNILFEYLLRLKDAIAISRDHLYKVKNFSPISKMDTWYTFFGREWFYINKEILIRCERSMNN